MTLYIPETARIPDLDNVYIAFTGNIASGKSNLARCMAAKYNFRISPERVDPEILQRYYSDRKKHGFPTQQFFMLTRAQELSKAGIVKGQWVSDFFYGVDSTVYAKNLLREGSIDEVQYAELVSYEQFLGQALPKPDLLVYLRATVDTLQERIRVRGIKEEEGLLNPTGREYLEQLDTLHEAAYNAHIGKRVAITTDELLLVPDFNRGNPRNTHIDMVLEYVVEELLRPQREIPGELTIRFG
jgi:deoxyadenosine/deoxycytidine kinase